MAEYRNEAKGARYVHLNGGGYKLVEAGATVEVDEGMVTRLGPGIVLDKRSLVSKAPAKVVAAVTGSKPKTAPSKAPARRKAPARKVPAKSKA